MVQQMGRQALWVSGYEGQGACCKVPGCDAGMHAKVAADDCRTSTAVC